MRRRILEATLVGMQHRVTKSTRIILRDKLPIPILLEREPMNEYDENAIKVIIEGKAQKDRPFGKLHLGYLRRQVAAELAPQFDSGETFFEKGSLVALDIDSGEGDLRLTLKLA